MSDSRSEPNAARAAGTPAGTSISATEAAVPSVEPVRTAEDLIELLRPTAPRWAPIPTERVFRGQRDSSWKLLPSAYRSEAWKRFARAGEAPFDAEASSSTSDEEFAVLLRFLEGLDLSGLDVPNDIFMRPLFEEGPTGLLSFPLDAAALIFVALAQHNGVPTRLLDWTRAGLNAAYFAATGAAKHATEKKERVEALSIWALRTNFAGWADQNLGQQNSPYAPGLRVVTAPRASNPNLHAQAGVFTESWSAIVAPLEAIVGDLLVRLARDSSAPWPPAQPPLVRFDLPTAQAPRLLRLLAYEQVDAARMFPGLGGVVAAIQEQSLWDRP